MWLGEALGELRCFSIGCLWIFFGSCRKFSLGDGGAKGRFEFSAKGTAILWMLLQNAAEALVVFWLCFFLIVE